MLIRFVCCLVCSSWISHCSWAACDQYNPTTGQTTVCDASAPNPTTTNVQATTGSTNVSVMIQTNSALAIQRTTSPVVVSVAANSTVSNSGSITLTGGGGSGTNRGAGVLGVGNNNVLTNEASATINTNGAFNDGMAANGSGNQFINHGNITTNSPNAYGMTAAWGQTNTGQANNTFINSGMVTTHGSSARGVSILGQNGSITNSGTLLTTGSGSNAVYMQGNGAMLSNSGLIHTTGLSDAVFSNTVGSTFTATIHNLAGGEIISDQGSAVRTLNGATTITNAGLLQGGGSTTINGGNGNLTLILQTGSSIVGLADGGSGNNQVILQGTGQLTNPFTDFQTLILQGEHWVWQGSGNFSHSYLQMGSLTLQRDLTGNVDIASGATLFAGDGALPVIMPSTTPIIVTNAGTIDLTNGSNAAANHLTIIGQYVGQNGLLRLRAVLGNDSSPTDRLIFSGAAATGATQVAMVNANGLGALTQGDGIMVVQATGGATTADHAFALGAPVAAGPYEYLLFKGGVSTDASTSNNWYLRSTMVEEPIGPTPPSPPTPEQIIPLYRVETPLYAAIPAVLYQTGLSVMGTFHERRGEQNVLHPAVPLSTVWLNVLGQELKQGWTGTVSPTFSGSLVGLQAGLDIISLSTWEQHHDHAGVFAGRTYTNGAVKGFALGASNTKVGNLHFDGTHTGVYWTHIGPTDWYIDGVLMHRWLDGEARSIRDIDMGVHRTSFLASMEGGYPLPLLPAWRLEPQWQVIWQNIPSVTTHDPFATMVFEGTQGITARIGTRLTSSIATSHGLLQPYLRMNVWRNFTSTGDIDFGAKNIRTRQQLTSIQFGGGLTYQVSTMLNVFFTADYAASIGSGQMQRTLISHAGMQVRL